MKGIFTFVFAVLLLCTTQLEAQTPTITSFSPGTGSIIDGSDFNSPTDVTIGGVPAVVVSNTGTNLIAQVMPGATTGTVDATTAGGTAKSAVSFTVTAAPFQGAQQGKLVGTGNTGDAWQGISVSLSADGNTAIVGGHRDNAGQGAAWVYTLSGGVWLQQGKLVGAGAVGNAIQGISVSLSADGNTAIVGGAFDNSGQGAAWIFTRSAGVWTQQGSKLVGTGNIGAAQQGYSVSLSADGNTAIVGGHRDNAGQGAAWVFTRSGGVWSQQGLKLVGTGAVGNAAQGWAVSLSADGNTAIVGGQSDSSGQGAAWVFTRSTGEWTQQGSKLVGTGAVGTAYQGCAVSLSADGNTAIVGGAYDSSNMGAAWVYTRSAGVWTQQGSKIVGTGNVGAACQGYAVSLSADGNTAIVGGAYDSSNMGAAWVYTRSAGVWMQQGSKIVGTENVGAAYQGCAVSLSADGNTVIVGGYADNALQGAAWVYTYLATATVSSVNSSSANGTYKIGSQISIQVNFSDVVIVTGTPQLKLETGTTDRTIDYASGSGTSTLTFVYTVQPGDISPDLDYQSTTALALNGGTIKDGNSKYAILTLALPAATNSLGKNKDIRVDGIVPTISSVTPPSGATYIVGQHLDYIVNFSEAVSVVTSAGTPYLTLTIGGTSKNATYLSGSGTSTLIFRYTVASGDFDSDGLALNSGITLDGGTIKNAAGNNSDLSFTGATAANVKVDGIVPTAIDVPAAATATASTGITSSGFTANWDPVATATSYSLEVSADDFATQISGSPFTILAPTVTNAFTDMSAGTIYKYRLKATNSSGSSGYGNVVTVKTLVPPTITDFSPEADVVAGTVVTITGTDFAGATAVSFGGIAATSFTVVSPTSITAVVAPAGASGNVSVTTPGGTVSLAGFTFLPPTSISSFSPASATTGQTVTIIGSGFTGASEVTFGGSAAKSFEVVSSTSIKAVVANGTSGDVSVTAAGGTGSKTGFTFNLCLEITAPANITVNVAPGSTGAIVNYTTPVGTNPCGYSKIYGCTYAVQTYTVPAGIYSVDYNLSGGRGGLGLTPIPGVYGSYYDVPGGYGGNITGKLAVNPGDVINVFVGDAGQSPHYNNSGSNYNGGGTYGYCNSGNFYGFGGNGGGATDLRIGGTALNNRVVVAGGGGGGGGANISSQGGAGGGSTGAMGAGQQANYGGGGGSQIAGGAAGGAGVATAYVTAGTFGVGGNGGGSLGGVNDNGGGGGGGYYGGGGGYWAGGGGGSSYPNVGNNGDVTVLTSTQGTNPGSGSATISYSLGGVPSTTRTAGLASGATFPIGTTTVTYEVTDGLGNSKSVSFNVTVNRQASITGFAPTTASPGQTVTITGTDFTGATSVSFNGVAATSYTVVSATTITAVVAATGADGATGNISVTTAAGTASRSGFTFSVIPPPVVSSVSVPADGTYVEGQNLDFTVNYSEAVTVVTTGGTPYIPVTLNTGGTVYASYISGNGSSALMFRYTVVSGDIDDDGVTLGSSIATNGGTIKSSFGLDATLALQSVSSTANVKVDAAPPTVSSILRLSPSASSTNANSITYRVTFDENVSGVDVSDFLLTASGASSGTIASVSAAGGNSFDVTINSGTGDGSLRLDVKGSGTGILDNVGNEMSGGYTSGSSFTIDKTPSTVSMVGVPANKTYTLGQTVDLVINYDEIVNVVTSGGVPYIPISLGSGGTARAVYVGGTGTSALIFRYTVVAGDYDTDGITIGSSVTTNGGTIKDDAGNDSTLALSGVGNTTGILVDGVVAPTTQASLLVFSDVQGYQLTIDWTNGSGSKRIVFIKEANTGTVAPANNSNYTANTVFASGSQIPSGWYCVYNGTGSNVTVTGLSLGTDYIVEVLEYNGPVGFEKYLAATSANNPKTQTTPMCANPTSGGTIATDQNGCIPYDVAVIANAAPPSGNVGILEYKWQKSETNSSTGFTDIANADQATYDPGVISVNTWYKRLARVTCVSSWSGAVESNVVRIAVTPPPVGGIVSGGTSPIMYGDATGILSLNDSFGSILKWQKRLASGFWADIASSSGTLTDTPTSIGTWEYRAVVTNGFCSETYSEPVSITVIPRILTITADKVSKAYGSVDPILTYTNSPALIGNDVLTGSLTRIAGENVGSYAINLGTLSANANYKLTFISNDLSISPKQLAIGDPTLTTSKTYDASTTAKVIAGTLTGVIAGDESHVGVVAVANYDTPIVGNGKAIDVVYSLMGTASGNYIKPIGYHTLTGEIVAKQLAISNTMVTTNKIIDGNTTAVVENVGTLSGVEADDLSNVSISAIASYNDASLGSSKTITVKYTLGGSAAGNYIVPVNLKISNAKIFEILVLETVQSSTAGCEGSSLDVTYTVSSGKPVQYQISFDAAALSAGFKNVSFTNLPSSDAKGILSIPILPGTPYGNYQASLQMRTELGTVSNLFPFQFVVNVSSDIIVPKFGDVIVCNNKANNFTAFQWYKNGKIIDGATNQYYNDIDGLVGSYSLKLKTTSGQEFFTCPKVLNKTISKKVTVSVFPNPMKASQESTVRISGMNQGELKGAVMNVYSIQGVRVYSTDKVEEFNLLRLQNQDGIYMVHIITAEGNDYSYRVLLVK